jgi:hypothetical protein
MKKSEIEVGGIYAATSGTSRFNRRTDRAVKVEVLELGVDRETHNWGGGYRARTVMKGDGVRVKLLDPIAKRETSYLANVKKGGEVIIPTRDLWIDWRGIEESRIHGEFGRTQRVAGRRADDRIAKEWDQYLSLLELPEDYSGEPGEVRSFASDGYGSPSPEDYPVLIRAALAEGEEALGVVEEAIARYESEREEEIATAREERDEALRAAGFDVPSSEEEEE